MRAFFWIGWSFLLASAAFPRESRALPGKDPDQIAYLWDEFSFNEKRAIVGEVERNEIAFSRNLTRRLLEDLDQLSRIDRVPRFATEYAAKISHYVESNSARLDDAVPRGLVTGERKLERELAIRLHFIAAKEAAPYDVLSLSADIGNLVVRVTGAPSDKKAGNVAMGEILAAASPGELDPYAVVAVQDLIAQRGETIDQMLVALGTLGIQPADLRLLPAEKRLSGIYHLKRAIALFEYRQRKEGKTIFISRFVSDPTNGNLRVEKARADLAGFFPERDGTWSEIANAAVRELETRKNYSAALISAAQVRALGLTLDPGLGKVPSEWLGHLVSEEPETIGRLLGEISYLVKFKRVPYETATASIDDLLKPLIYAVGDLAPKEACAALEKSIFSYPQIFSAETKKLAMSRTVIDELTTELIGVARNGIDYATLDIYLNAIETVASAAEPGEVDRFASNLLEGMGSQDRREALLIRAKVASTATEANPGAIRRLLYEGLAHDGNSWSILSGLLKNPDAREIFRREPEKVIEIVRNQVGRNGFNGTSRGYFVDAYPLLSADHQAELVSVLKRDLYAEGKKVASDDVALFEAQIARLTSSTRLMSDHPALIRDKRSWCLSLLKAIGIR